MQSIHFSYSTNVDRWSGIGLSRNCISQCHFKLVFTENKPWPLYFSVRICIHSWKNVYRFFSTSCYTTIAGKINNLSIQEWKHISTKLWNIIGEGRIPVVKCPLTMSNVSNLRCPVTPGLPTIVISTDWCSHGTQRQSLWTKLKQFQLRQVSPRLTRFHIIVVWYVFSCDQAALWMVFSVRLSVCLSVCPSVRLSHLLDYVPIIVSSWNFQELSHWTRVRSMQKVKVRGQRSRSQRSRPKFSFPDCNSSLNSHMMMKWYI